MLCLIINYYYYALFLNALNKMQSVTDKKKDKYLSDRVCPCLTEYVPYWMTIVSFILKNNSSLHFLMSQLHNCIHS